ncbi:MAG: hypothetical protein CMI13_01350 [Oleibacter sp.]|nr:hypothetical protein [Thalassolituus sp.]
MSDYILSFDQGTTSSRAIIFSASGGICGVGQHEFPQIFPQPGWVEHNPADIWQSTLQAARDAIENAGISAADIRVAGITNQRETTLIWDRNSGEPVHNAIVWQDRRTASFCQQLKQQHDGIEELISEVQKNIVSAVDTMEVNRTMVDKTVESSGEVSATLNEIRLSMENIRDKTGGIVRSANEQQQSAADLESNLAAIRSSGEQTSANAEGTVKAVRSAQQITADLAQRVQQFKV